MPRSLLILAVLLPFATGSAQAPAADRSLRLAVENDLIAMRGAGPPPDYDYTHGTRITDARPGAPAWLRRRTGRRPECRAAAATRERGCVASAVEIGQEIYTPRRDGTTPVAGERPYAGWLYAAGTAYLISPGRVRSIRAAVGVTGRPAFAAEVQAAIHRLLRNDPQLGWSHQLAFEPTVVLQYDEQWVREHALGGGGLGRVALSGGAAAGNVRAALWLGVDGTLGLPGRLPWVPIEPAVQRPMRFYVVGGYRRELVLHDLFLDGNTFRASPRADRRASVGQYQLGVGMRRRALALEYRHVARGREYSAQPGPHAYGSVLLTLHHF
jgi:hypothetical protein